MRARIRDADETIKDILKKGPKTPEEFRSECLKKGLTKQTYYRHLKKLVNQGEIQDARYKLVERVLDADPEEVRRCVKMILKEIDNGNRNVLLGRITELEQLSHGKRTAHLPNLISCLEKCLKSQIVTSDNEILEKTVQTLGNILRFEHNHRNIESKRIIQRVLDSTLKEVVSLIKKQDFPPSFIIGFLGITGRTKAVDILFEKIRGNPSKAMEKLNDLSSSLGRQGLYETQQKHVNKCLYELLESESELLVKFARDLQRKILWST
jgi:hypothetical protein